MGRQKKNNVVRGYKSLLQKDKDWDYEYLLLLEQKKLRRMAIYFSKVETDRQIAKELTLCVRLLDIILDNEGFVKKWCSEAGEFLDMHSQKNPDGKTYSVCFEYKGPLPDFPKYVNVRNSFWFTNLTGYPENFESPYEQKYWEEHYKEELRKAKAWHLYNICREYRMFGWWI